MEEIWNGTPLEEVAEGVFSSLGKSERGSSYDGKVRAYDLLIGNRFYNRLVWGNWPSQYAGFCREALASARGGTYLDAGCGSLVFTADVYATASNRRIVLLDRSIGMLVKARERIRERVGSVPENIHFVQGDIFHLPFKAGVFDAVASFGVLHIFSEKASVLNELERVARSPGRIYFSSLAGNNAFGRRYLEVLKKAGEVAALETSESLGQWLSTRPLSYEVKTVGNMAYARSL